MTPTGVILVGVFLSALSQSPASLTFDDLFAFSHVAKGGANEALSVSIDMAKWLGADLHWISIEEDLPHDAIGLARESRTEQEESRYFQRIVDEAREAHKEGITLHPHILPGHEVETVVRFVGSPRGTSGSWALKGHSNILGRIWGR